jgi:glucosamine--fructose-6-phosphate aminotransferase (isomerizing)
MCGIVGYAGCDKAGPVLFDTLKRLEYRGYDSAGVAIISDGDLLVFKSAGRIADLENAYLKDGAPGSSTGIGHTRWATHGPPTTENAHPHVSGDVAVVHNGIIENYLELKEELLSRGFVFRSDTDTEVLAHMIGSFYMGDLEEAVRSAVCRVEGSYAIAALARGSSRLVCARNESPLVIGIGKGANYVASDVSALLPYTRDIVRMNDGEIAVIDHERVVLRDLGGILLPLDLERVDWDVEAAERAGYPHFMLKEIHEQPRSVQETIASRISEIDGDVRIEIGLTVDEIRALDRVSIVACGTSYHAAVLAKYLYPKAAGLPVDVEVASEFQHHLLRPGTLLLSITQSGETADTLSAMKRASTFGVKRIAISNVVGSTVTRMVDETIYTRCGPEIGVAATKTFTGQLVALILLAIKLGRAKNHLSRESSRKMLVELTRLPGQIQEVLERRDEIREIAEMYAKSDRYFFIGRDFLYPIALEGALKMKEISYISAEGYPAGELKHGPLALITEGTPVVALATFGKKIQANIKEVRARGADVIAFASEGDPDISKIANTVVELPEARPVFSSVLCTVALQLLAYHTADARGLPIDKPRNLAKSVTVE